MPDQPTPGANDLTPSSAARAAHAARPVWEPAARLVQVSINDARPSPASETADLWAPPLEAGPQWLSALAATPSAQPLGGGEGRALRITTDPSTGQRSQKLPLPLPDPASMQRLAKGLTGLLARLHR